jgi:uncharacterized protein Yka (UPF0111/DUF47 family)
MARDRDILSDDQFIDLFAKGLHRLDHMEQAIRQLEARIDQLETALVAGLKENSNTVAASLIEFVALKLKILAFIDFAVKVKVDPPKVED